MTIHATTYDDFAPSGLDWFSSTAPRGLTRTATRRKTRSGCWLSSTGWDLNQRVPTKGFKVTSCYSSSFLKHGKRFACLRGARIMHVDLMA